MRLLFILCIVLAIFASSVSAAQDSVTLLALSSEGENSTGVLADLTLEARQGSERVFLETFPLTRIATQVSMRFAQQISCEELDFDCSRTDFLYTISASGGIVGGPSAGAAAAVLTASVLDKRKIDKSVAITGSINSGGLIGPVGGLRQKIDAAAKNGIKTVLIPKGSANAKEDNTTIDLVEYGRNLGITVAEVATLDEAMEVFTGKGLNYADEEFVIDEEYRSIMKDIAIDLCTRGRDLLKGKNIKTAEYEQILNLSTVADNFFSGGDYYSAASFCFRANIEIKQKSLKQARLGISRLRQEAAEALIDILAVDGNADRQEIDSVTDVQTYMLVKERVFEAQEVLARLALQNNVTNESIRDLAYAQERAFSAKTWSRFFDTGGKKLSVDNATLSRYCQTKLSEAEERYNYVQSFFPNSLQETRKLLGRAEDNSKKGNYVLCIHEASRAKSEADILLSVTGFEDENIQDIIDIKLGTTERAMIRAQKNGIFPLIGYSYWEYSKALREDDPYSSLLFAEYANELSSLDIYFDNKNGILAQSRLDFSIRPELAAALLAGFLLGGAVMLWCTRRN